MQGQIALMLLAVMGVLVAFLYQRYPDAMHEHQDWAHLISTIGFATLIGSAVLHSSWQRNTPIVKYTLIWAGIGLLAVGAYSYRYEFSRIAQRIGGELVPDMAQVQSDGSLRFTAASDGHFYITAEVNNTPIRFMVDTGASDIVLSTQDAARAGINIKALEYNRLYSTANGKTRGASTQIKRFSIGDSFIVNNVFASVNEGDMRGSLLGMRFLEKLGGYEVYQGTLTLYP